MRRRRRRGGREGEVDRWGSVVAIGGQTHARGIKTKGVGPTRAASVRPAGPAPRAVLTTNPATHKRPPPKPDEQGWSTSRVQRLKTSLPRASTAHFASSARRTAPRSAATRLTARSPALAGSSSSFVLTSLPRCLPCCSGTAQGASVMSLRDLGLIQSNIGFFLPQG